MKITKIKKVPDSNGSILKVTIAGNWFRKEKTRCVYRRFKPSKPNEWFFMDTGKSLPTKYEYVLDRFIYSEVDNLVLTFEPLPRIP